MRSTRFNLVIAATLGLAFIGGAQAQFSGRVGTMGATAAANIGSSIGTAPAAAADAAPATNLLNTLRSQSYQPARRQCTG